jgi:hypothetical protein
MALLRALALLLIVSPVAMASFKFSSTFSRKDAGIDADVKKAQEDRRWMADRTQNRIDIENALNKNKLKVLSSLNKEAQMRLDALHKEDEARLAIIAQKEAEDESMKVEYEFYAKAEEGIAAHKRSATIKANADKIAKANADAQAAATATAQDQADDQAKTLELLTPFMTSFLKANAEANAELLKGIIKELRGEEL